MKQRGFINSENTPETLLRERGGRTRVGPLVAMVGTGLLIGNAFRSIFEKPSINATAKTSQQTPDDRPNKPSVFPKVVHATKTTVSSSSSSTPNSIATSIVAQSPVNSTSTVTPETTTQVKLPEPTAQSLQDSSKHQENGPEIPDGLVPLGTVIYVEIKEGEGRKRIPVKFSRDVLWFNGKPYELHAKKFKFFPRVRIGTVTKVNGGFDVEGGLPSDIAEDGIAFEESAHWTPKEMKKICQILKDGGKIVDFTLETAENKKVLRFIPVQSEEQGEKIAVATPEGEKTGN